MQQKYRSKIKRYSNIFAVDEKDVINAMLHHCTEINDTAAMYFLYDYYKAEYNNKYANEWLKRQDLKEQNRKFYIDKEEILDLFYKD